MRKKLASESTRKKRPLLSQSNSDPLPYRHRSETHRCGREESATDLRVRRTFVWFDVDRRVTPTRGGMIAYGTGSSHHDF